MSKHAQRRAVQRNLNTRDIEYILIHGSLEYKTGIDFYILRKCDIPHDDQRISWIARLMGAAILLRYRDNKVITVVRNQAYLREVQRKPKWRS